MRVCENIEKARSHIMEIKMQILSKALLIVNVTIDSEFEAEWNDWYDKVHLPEILSCPGFRGAARYVCQLNNGRHYLTIYEIESPQAIESVEFNKRRGWGKFKEKVQASVRVFNQISYMEDTNENKK